MIIKDSTASASSGIELFLIRGDTWAKEKAQRMVALINEPLFWLNLKWYSNLLI
jgi:hypothetical protein